MKFSQLWILRKLAIIVWILMTEISFNCGIIPCASNSSEDHNFLPDYLSLVHNKSRELEEIIYSDIFNNLRNLVRVQNNKTESTNEFNKSKGNLKIEKLEWNKGNRIGNSSLEYNVNENNNGGNTKKLESNNGNRTESSQLSYAPVYDVLLSGEDEKKRTEWRNVMPGVTEVFPRNGYLLGYSGNPFGSRKLVVGPTEMSEDGHNERVVIDPRKKRSVLHLYNMVLCSTGCDPIAYKGYGCYCGFLGSGFVVDGIDSCCKMHDWCYNSAGCPMFLEYFIPYLWKCYHRQPLCAIDHGYYGSSGSCSQRLCECDRQLALCLRKYPCPRTKALCTSSPWRLLQNILML